MFMFCLPFFFLGFSVVSVLLSFPLEFPSRAAACGRLRSVRKATTDGATVATVAAENVVNEACMEAWNW